MNFGIGDLMGSELYGNAVNTSEARVPKESSLDQQATGVSPGATTATITATGNDDKGAVHWGVIIIILSLIILWWLGAISLKGLNK